MKFLKLMADLSIGRLLVLALFVTIAYYFMYFDDGSFLKEQIANVSNAAQEETNRRAGIEQTMKKEEEMRGNLLQLARNLEVVKSKIPNEFKDTQMSAIINEASTLSGVSVLELSTNASMNQAPRPPPAPGEAIRPEDLVEEVKFNITVSGSYEAFLKFLDALTKEDKVIKVRNFTIERNSTGVDDDSIRFKGEIVGFKQAAALANKEQPGATPPAEGNP